MLSNYRIALPRRTTTRMATPAPAGDGVLALDRTHTPSLNLAVLQRVDPSIEAVVASASHAAVYENKTGNQEWVRARRGP